MLNKEQVQQIEELCTAENIKYYDVKLEMVDHISQGIENVLEERPSVTFEEAVKKVANNIGLYGFAKMIGQKEAQIKEAVRKQQRTLFRSFFSWPGVAATCIVYLLLAAPALFFETTPKDHVKIQRTVSLLCLFIGGAYAFLKFRRPKQFLLSLPLLIEFRWGFWLFQVFNIYLHGFRLLKDQAWTTSSWFTLTTTLVTTLSLMFALAWFIVYDSVYKKARKNYPLAFAESAPLRKSVRPWIYNEY